MLVTRTNNAGQWPGKITWLHGHKLSANVRVFDMADLQHLGGISWEDKEAKF